MPLLRSAAPTSRATAQRDTPRRRASAISRASYAYATTLSVGAPVHLHRNAGTFSHARAKHIFRAPAPISPPRAFFFHIARLICPAPSVPAGARTPLPRERQPASRAARPETPCAAGSEAALAPGGAAPPERHHPQNVSNISGQRHQRNTVRQTAAADRGDGAEVDIADKPPHLLQHMFRL